MYISSSYDNNVLVYHLWHCVSCAEDGHEEMVDELSGNKAIYAIIKVKDPNSGLKKMVQINWVSGVVY